MATKRRILTALTATVFAGLANGGAVADQVSTDARTGRPVLDISKPLFLIQGGAMCPSESEVDAYRQKAPNACRFALIDFSVAEMEMRGFLNPVYRVRLKDREGPVVEVWTPLQALRN